MKRLRSLGALAVLLAAAGLLLRPGATQASDATTVGVTPFLSSAQELIARAHEVGNATTFLGYLTHVAGLSDGQLFFGGLPGDVSTARFTFVGHTVINGLHAEGNVTNTSAPGTLNVFVRSAPGADFNDPGSFSDGLEIARSDVRYFSVFTFLAPDAGITQATIDVSQTFAQPFGLAGHRYRLGRSGLHAKLRGGGSVSIASLQPVDASFFLGASLEATNP